MHHNTPFSGLKIPNFLGRDTAPLQTPDLSGVPLLHTRPPSSPPTSNYFGNSMARQENAGTGKYRNRKCRTGKEGPINFTTGKCQTGITHYSF